MVPTTTVRLQPGGRHEDQRHVDTPTRSLGLWPGRWPCHRSRSQRVRCRRGERAVAALAAIFRRSSHLHRRLLELGMRPRGPSPKSRLLERTGGAVPAFAAVLLRPPHLHRDVLRSEARVSGGDEPRPGHRRPVLHRGPPPRAVRLGLLLLAGELRARLAVFRLLARVHEEHVAAEAHASQPDADIVGREELSAKELMVDCAQGRDLSVPGQSLHQCARGRDQEAPAQVREERKGARRGHEGNPLTPSPTRGLKEGHMKLLRLRPSCDEPEDNEGRH
mmetsp:Transcript_96036/g.277327  ORF Transcript_96036/g.277327 Transcript_96036/m.277327 type:complete len:277 (+) Transcript_96036:424-1254(+)